MRPSAILFDVDGTLAETELEGHLPAFNQAMQEAGLGWQWTPDDYQRLLKVTGGFERLVADARERGAEDLLDEAGLARLKAIHQRKNALYAERLAAGLIPPRPGLILSLRMLVDAGIDWAVVTTTSRSNWEALWTYSLAPQGAPLPLLSICGEDVTDKKPHPEAYLLALKRIGYPATDCLAVEDSRNGLVAAHAAGLGCVIVRSHFFAQEDFREARLVVDSHERLRLVDL